MITAILRDKNGFEKKIKIFEPVPVLELPDFRDAKLGNIDELNSQPVGTKKWIFYRAKQLSKRTFLYEQI